MKLARNSGHRFTPVYQLHIDEAGRGPLAGPVAVGCVLVHGKTDLTIFKDSKQLSEKQRDALYSIIQAQTASGIVSPGVGYSSNAIIDRVGMIASLQAASLQAIGQCLLHAYLTHWRSALLHSPYGENIIAVTELDILLNTSKFTLKRIRSVLMVEQTIFSISALLIDGNHSFGLDALPINVTTIIKGDSKNTKISMASIIAKVERDTWMKKIAKNVPQYGLERHKGYGTYFHRKTITQHGLSKFHRRSFCGNCIDLSVQTKTYTHRGLSPKGGSSLAPLYTMNKTLGHLQTQLPTLSHEKPGLLLHICCGPDLTRPLHRLKNHFKLYLFWYNPNIHPRKEHTKRYAQFIKLVGLEEGDYEIIEDRYDPKEFFKAMIQQKTTISSDLADADKKTVLTVAGDMQERSDRCNPCYSMRLDQAAKQAVQHQISYFTSTLLISPKKHGGKLFDRGVDAQAKHGSHFLWFDFAKNEGYTKAVHLTRKHKLRRQQYCGCGWTIPKPGEKRKAYSGG